MITHRSLLIISRDILERLLILVEKSPRLGFTILISQTYSIKVWYWWGFKELIIICYFWKNLKPSIKVKMKQQDCTSTSFKKIIWQAVNTKAIASLLSSAMV